MTTLITGAGGQVGRDLAAALFARGENVLATDVAGPPRDWDGKIGWKILDVRDRAAIENILTRARPGRVFHLAAVLSVKAEKSPMLAYEVNQTGWWNVLESCRAAGVGQVIFPSSIAAFGPGIGAKAADDSPLRPTTLYGIAKVCGELWGEYYFRRWGLDFRSVRFPGLVSATEPGGGTSDYAVYMYTESARAGKYEAYCRPETRIPLMYMPDAIEALIKLSQAPAGKLRRRVYNVAAFSPTAQEIATEVERAIPGAKITFAEDAARQAILDSWPRELEDRNAREDWGWRAKFDLKTMTQEMVGKLGASVRK